MTNVLQRWTSLNIKERGLVVWSKDEGNQLFRVALFRDGCNTGVDPSCVEPELNVYYVTSEEIE